MKKLFHLGLMALFVISVSSCSKSADDLLTNDDAVDASAARTIATPTSQPHTPAIPIMLAAELPAETSIHPFINQPHELELGDLKSSILMGDRDQSAVFYVLVAAEYMNEPLKKAKLTLLDTESAESIAVYDLISYEEVSNYDVKIPAGLENETFLFAIVSLNDLQSHINKSISLFSRISTRTGALTAQLKNAFIYQP